jgi:diguanylate cyclase (GGDEF)-like protein
MIVFAVLGLVLLVVYDLDPDIRDQLYIVAALGAAGAIVIGIRRHGAQQPGWWIVALGLTLFSIGHLLDACSTPSTGTEPLPYTAFALYFAGEVALVIGIASLAGTGGDRYYRPALLDAMLVAIAFGFVAWVALIGPIVDRAGDPLMGAVAIAVPAVDIVLVGVLAFHLFQPSQNCTATLLLTIGVLSWLVADLAYAAVSVTDSYARGGPVDTGWLIGYLLIGAAGLHPSMAAVARARETREAALSDRRLALTTATLLIPIVSFAARGPGAEAADYRAFVLWSASAALVGGARLLGSIRSSRTLLEDQRKLQLELDRLARTDHLTGLMNRYELTDRLSDAFAGPEPVGLLFLDLDDFKRINDAFGHQTGDALLKQVADRIQASVRTHDHVARLGGDEFAILLAECHSLADAVGVAERVLAAFDREIRLEGHMTRIQPSIGIVCSPARELTANEALSRADIAMYLAKEKGGGVYEVFAPAMHDRALARARLRSDLEHAVGRGEIVPWYQPIFEVRSGRLLGVEALARWQHPERGLLAPAEFIPLAEASVGTGEIDRSILMAATADVARWCVSRSLDLQLHVNFSPSEVADPGTVLAIGAALEASGLDPTQLVVEVTETALVDASAVATTLDGLKELGARLAIDDFGSRYAVIAELARLPIDIVKIDRCLLSGIESPDGHRLLHGILRLADSLGLETIAEGVESATIVPILRRLGCTAAQGYALGRPMPPDELERRLPAWTFEADAIA